LGRPFLWTVGAIIDMREGTIKYQFPLKKGKEHFPRKRNKLLFDSILRANYDLDASSLNITWFALSAPSSKALKKSTLGRKPNVFTFSSFSFIWVLEVITTVINSPYYFYFVFVPREASNLSEVRFGDVAVLKLFSVLHRKNSWKFSIYLLDLRYLVHMPQVISKLSLFEHFLIWATENPLKIRPLSGVLFWQIFANICVCRFIAFFLSSFDHRTFGEVASIYFICGGFELKPEAKRVDLMLYLH
jgi:hypothetical protein